MTTDNASEKTETDKENLAKAIRGTSLTSRQTENETGNYLDFEIEIGPGQGSQYPLAVIDSPAGEVRETLHFPFDESTLESRLKSLEIALLRSGGSRRQVLSPEEQSVQDFGLQLFASLFSGETRTRFDMSSDIARQRGLGLRLKLRIQAPELARLPWEFLYDPRQAEYVCMSRDTPIVRYIELPQTIKPLKVAPPLRILGVVSSPSDLPALEVAREKQRLEKAIAGLQSENQLELIWLANPTWRELQRAMRTGPWHIFHFIGHGGFDTIADEGILAFEDETGTAQLLLATELGRLLADHRSLRLALLNSCEGARASQRDIFSSSAAVLVRRGLPAVLAMQYAITDRAAIEFSRAFYEALADGLPVDAAVCEARKAISLAITNTIEWGTPVLYMRSPQGIIFELPKHNRINLSDSSLSIRQDKEVESQIEHLYTEGRAAFWVEDWDRACSRFQAILDIRPDHPEAVSALKEANQNRQRAALHARAWEAIQAEKWSEAINALEVLITQDPGYKDAASLLQTARQKHQVTELYEEARKLHTASQWQAVLRVFEQLRTIQPDFPDPDGLLPSAEKEVAELKRQVMLDADYSQAIRAMDAGHWQAALTLLEKIQMGKPGYRQSRSLLKRAQDELRKVEKNREAQEQVGSLYGQAHGLVHAKQWSKASEKLNQIYTLDENFPDPDGLASKVESALQGEEQEAQRQGELSVMYAEAVRLLKEEKYEAALEKWSEIHAWDPKFPDRQKVQSLAKRKIGKLDKPKFTIPHFLKKARWKIIIPAAILLMVTGIWGIFFWESDYYDNFDNPIYNGRYNTSKWVRDQQPQGDIFQENGRLIFTLSGPEKGLGLWAKDVKFPLPDNKYTYIEAKLSQISGFGELSIAVRTNMRLFSCGIDKRSGFQRNTCWTEKIRSGAGYGSLVNYFSLGSSYTTIVIKIDPNARLISFYFDGNKKASYILSHGESLPESVSLGCWVQSYSEFQGYFDYVKIYSANE
jgi:outer membrane protein assembly factor BamD (BamD/ComL family)